MTLSVSLLCSTWIWSWVVRLLFGLGKPRTYSYQNVIPRLAVPSLADTCANYLECARPLLDDAEFDRMKRLAEEFQENEGPGLQRLLMLKSWFVPNYVTDWWERFVYLRGRDPIMINSNYYMMDAYEWIPTRIPVARAANLIYSALEYKVWVEEEHIGNLKCTVACFFCPNCGSSKENVLFNSYLRIFFFFYYYYYYFFFFLFFIPTPFYGRIDSVGP